MQTFPICKNLWPKWAFCLCAFVLPLAAVSQIDDGFSDGDLSNNPTWLGDAADFQVNAQSELQLKAPEAGISTLYLPTQITDSAVWEMYVRMEFAPSTSNFLKIYLQSDSPDLLTGSGYYLLVGESGSEDALKFFRQDAGASTLLAAGTLGGVATNPNLRIKLTKEDGGLWKMAVDYTGGANFTPEFEVTDATYGSGSYFFGFYCEYTDSRKEAYFFDDILVAELLPDIQPPSLVSATPVSASEVDVVFNEPLDETSATEPSNFNINNGIGTPAAAFLDALDKTLVHLSLANPLVSQTDYVLTSNGLSDLNGNISTSQTASFSYIELAEAVQFDILINEIMADPSPVVALPDVEFIELYNRSNKVIDLAGFGFSSGSTPQLFPSFQMLPGSYVLVCDDSNVGQMSTYGNVIGLATFPALTNTADDLSLTNPDGETIHFVSYSLAWYKDSGKEEGGWTLELVNPLSPCIGEANWRASENLLGGTPGQPNSVLNEALDETGPELIRAFVSVDAPSELRLYFNENLDKTAAENPSHYSISNGVAISAASLLAPANNVVFLQLAAPLEKSVLYEVTVLNDVTDCSGNAIGSNDKLPLALPEPIEPQDVVINEILFNPETGGVDFLEVYNRSSKIFNLADLIIGNLEVGVDTVTVPVPEDHLLFPNSYAVFTENRGDILSRYTVQNENALIENDLPSFNDDAGNITLFRADTVLATIIDAFDYNEDFHHPFLDDVAGVSLERLSPASPTQDRNNWHSAAKSAGFATPTYQNSQLIVNQTAADDFFAIIDPTFSPDGDGYQDFLTIIFQTDKPGYAAQIKIFDAEGRLVKTLANTDLLATEGFLRWDGDTDDGEKARIGIYVLWIEIFHPDGDKRDFKKTCVVAGRL